MDQLGEIFDSMVNEMTIGMADNDLVRFVLQGKSLDYPISLPFMSLHELNAERVMGEVQRVLQLNENVNLQDGMQVHLVYVGMPQGGVAFRKRKHGFKLSKFLDTKKASYEFEIRICCALPVLWLHTWLARRNIPTGTLFVKDVNGKASWPKSCIRRLCGLSEVATFQQVIEDYQIVILSSDHFNAIVYEGPRREKQIYLYHHKNHFDVITSVSSFLGKGYWCLECKRGYDKKERHRCNKVCKCCFTEGCRGIIEKARWRECGQCQRMFAGDDCYTNHTRPDKTGQSKVW